MRNLIAMMDMINAPHKVISIDFICDDVLAVFCVPNSIHATPETVSKPLSKCSRALTNSTPNGKRRASRRSRSALTFTHIGGRFVVLIFFRRSHDIADACQVARDAISANAKYSLR